MHDYKSTTVEVMMNRNPHWVTLSEPLQQVDDFKLEYIKIVDLPALNFPPKFLFLDISGLRDRPKLVINRVPTGTWSSATVSTPSALGHPLYFKLDEQAPSNINAYNNLMIHGYQNKMGYQISDVPRISDFNVVINNERQIPLVFGPDTVAQLLFKVIYRGKRNLDPVDQVKRYNQLQS